MRKLFLLTTMIGFLSFSVPPDLSFAGKQVKKQVVQGKAKQKAKALKKKRITYRKPRYAKNVNKPQEGQLLKLEAMVKDLNEQ